MSSSLKLSPADTILTLITRSFPSITTKVSEDSCPSSILTLPDSSTVTGVNTIARYLSSQIFPENQYHYTPLENALIDQWLSLTSPVSLSGENTNRILTELNAHLKDKATLIGFKPSIADVVAYVRVKELAKGWTTEERVGGPDGGWRYILRWLDFVQNNPLLNLKLAEGEALEIDLDNTGTVVRGEEPVDEKKAKKGKGKEKAGAGDETLVQKGKAAVKAAAEQITAIGTGATPIALAEGAADKGKRTKKEKAPKQPAAKKEEPAGPSPSQIDLRVGFIEKCIPHPDADSLYVSTIQCGDDEPRTVCSGLNGLIPLEQMQQRYVVVVCNLKPVKMRGIMSAAMVLAASPRPQPGVEDDHKGPVELVAPPEGVKAGEKVFFEGYDGTPEAVLNPKKKIWEAVQPGFTTTNGLEVGFDVTATSVPAQGEGVKRLVTASGGVCTVSSLIGAVVR